MSIVTRCVGIIRTDILHSCPKCIIYEFGIIDFSYYLQRSVHINLLALYILLQPFKLNYGLQYLMWYEGPNFEDLPTFDVEQENHGNYPHFKERILPQDAFNHIIELCLTRTKYMWKADIGSILSCI